MAGRARSLRSLETWYCLGRAVALLRCGLLCGILPRVLVLLPVVLTHLRTRRTALRRDVHALNPMESRVDPRVESMETYVSMDRAAWRASLVTTPPSQVSLSFEYVFEPISPSIHTRVLVLVLVVVLGRVLVVVLVRVEGTIHPYT